MTIFDVIEKQKSNFCLQFFLLKSSLHTQKSTFTAKFSPISSLEVIFFALILCWGRATASHHNCTACWGNSQNFRQRSFLPHTFHIYIKSTATPTYIVPPNFCACCVLQRSQIPKYAVVGQEIHP